MVVNIVIIVIECVYLFTKLHSLCHFCKQLMFKRNNLKHITSFITSKCFECFIASIIMDRTTETSIKTKMTTLKKYFVFISFHFMSMSHMDISMKFTQNYYFIYSRIYIYTYTKELGYFWDQFASKRKQIETN